MDLKIKLPPMCHRRKFKLGCEVLSFAITCSMILWYTNQQHTVKALLCSSHPSTSAESPGQSHQPDLWPCCLHSCGSPGPAPAPPLFSLRCSPAKPSNRNQAPNKPHSMIHYRFSTFQINITHIIWKLYICIHKYIATACKKTKEYWLTGL